MMPLSPTHAMLGQIERRYDAAFVNRVANHPEDGAVRAGGKFKRVHKKTAGEAT